MEIKSYIQPHVTIRIDSSVYEIMECFQLDKALSFVVVINQFNEPLGIVRERSLRDYTFTMFGHELLKRQTVSQFLSPCPIIPYETRFEDLIKTPTFQHREEGFIALKGGMYCGFVPVVSLLDMYEKHRLHIQQQLFQAQKMEAIGNLAGGIAHDFNNILASITAQSTLMKRRLISPEDSLVNHLDTIESLAFRAANLTRQLLGFARGGQYQKHPLNVNDVISQVIAIAHQTFGCSILFEERFSPTLKIVEGDRGQLEQVLLNLFINARDAMPDGGTITVTTWNIRASDEITVHTLNGCRNGGIAVSVTDTGTGIPKEIQKRIFEPFFTTKEKDKGTGMGLAMAYGIVGNHGGHIEVQSEPGSGATFTMYFPSCSPDSSPASNRANEPFQRPGIVSENGQVHIMLIEDDHILRSGLHDYLEQIGYRVYPFADGDEAIRYFKEQHHTVEMVLLDMIMPAISGQQVFSELRRINPAIKVLFMSGYSRSENVQNLLTHKHTDFIQKPFTFEKLLTNISEILN